MFKRLGQGSRYEEAPVSALMFKRLGQEARNEQPPIPATVFTQPIPALMFKRLVQETKKRASTHPGHCVHTAHPCHDLPQTTPVVSWVRPSNY
jgi:hypothetical protein